MQKRPDAVPTGNTRRVVSGPGNTLTDPKQSAGKMDHDTPVGNILGNVQMIRISRETDPYSAKPKTSANADLRLDELTSKSLPGLQEEWFKGKGNRIIDTEIP